MTGCAQLDCSEGSCFNAHVKVITWNRMDWTTHCIVHVPGLILPWKAEKQVWGHRTMAGETLLLGVVAVIALVAPDSCFFFFSLKLQEPLAALLRALQAFEWVRVISDGPASSEAYARPLLGGLVLVAANAWAEPLFKVSLLRLSVSMWVLWIKS